MPAARDTVVRSRAASRSHAKYAWSGRERLGLLQVREGAIVLHAMRWPDEARDPDDLLPPASEVSESERSRARWR
ncbi:hypothetical protein AB0G51_20400 [Streptomyces asoensis]|uniref:hypothetical protein n=1 Tax=Streptomyces asoensis TaxID=249586 RepID=UPI0033F48FEE